jgi:two-component response regulator (ARR-B family)
MVKPVRLEQLRGIWTHVVKNSKTDHAICKLPCGHGDKVEKAGANHTKNYSRKNKKAMDVADQKDNTST